MRTDRRNGTEVKGREATEYAARAQRRKFSQAYKRRILAEADGCEGWGEIGALLRREGLYSSHLTTWREQASRGELAEKVSGKRSHKGKSQAEEARELQRENAGLRQQLEQATAIISAQKKLSQALEQLLGGEKDAT